MEKHVLRITCLFLVFYIGVCDEKRDSKPCIIRTRILNFGYTFEPHKCYICSCSEEGFLYCKNVTADNCPALPCDAAVQISTPDRCCKICPGTGARCRFNGMTVEDGESFQLSPHGSCSCKNGKLTCDKQCQNCQSAQHI